MYRDVLTMFAGYNRWANARLYAAVANLNEEDFLADRGLFFGSLMRTLNHILVADRIWLRRMTGTGTAPDRLDAVLFPDLPSLREAREAEDERIATWIASREEAAFLQLITYRPITTPRETSRVLGPLLFHVFNHQTHHRGQCHAALTGLGREAPSLDLAAYQMEAGPTL